MSARLREPVDAASPVHDGEIIAGKYEVDRVLGQGGMGVVVAAHHIQLQTKVAIKFLLPAALSVPGAAQRFLREARSAVAIQSEHVARVLDVGTLESGAPYMVMEYLTGSDLGEIVRRDGALAIPEAIGYLLQACEAMAEAHALGIVHRDLKPDNVFLTRRADGSALVKVLDFGLSKATKDDALSPSAPSLTATNMVAGSPQYMSPEQVRSLKNVDARTDVWALGVILYELVTGQRPFDADTVAGVFAKIAADAPLEPRTLRRDIPPALELAILRCLEKDVSRRVQDVAELALALQPFAPAESQTSVDRIVRLGGGARSSPGTSPSAKAVAARVDGLEADIPTMAAAPPPPPETPAGVQHSAVRPAARAAPPARAAAPTRAAAPPTRTPAHGPAASSAPPPSPSPRADLLLHDEPRMEVDLSGIRAAHPAQRGRPALRRDFEEEKTNVGDLRIGGPIVVLVLAFLIAALDMISARLLGQTEAFSLGPVRPFWLAGPLAVLGTVWLVRRILSR